jgi:hypothetical protein
MAPRRRLATVAKTANQIIACLEGALMIARLQRNDAALARLKTTWSHLLKAKFGSR